MTRSSLGISARLAALCLAVFAGEAFAQAHHDHAGMRVGDGGLVMGENTAQLPSGCSTVSGDHRFEVRAGRRHAAALAGAVYAYDERDFRVPPCSRVTVRFLNDDEVRHQWMVHGLPRYLYPGGMFHLEANGGAEVSGTFIVPAEDATYLVHCDIAQHMEKGMKAQLVVGRGNGSLWAVPGLSGALNRDDYLPVPAAWLLLPAALLGGLLGWWLGRGSGHA